MTLPDDLLDDDGDVIYCLYHSRYRPCIECEEDKADLYADMKIQDEKEGK